MSQIAVAYFVGDGAAVYLPFGFCPDYALLVLWGADTAVDFYHYFKLIEDNGAAACAGGVLVNEGVTDVVAHDSGLAAYDTASNGPTVDGWTTAVSTAATARTSTAHGSYCHPSISNTQGFDVNAIFECVTAGTGAATEPTWPKDPGGQVTDGDTVWERVDADVPLTRVGYKGLAVDFSISDSVECTCLAIDADLSFNWGDVVGWTDGVYGK
jgi:hypothetical protein